jgi:VWFA-related protein
MNLQKFFVLILFFIFSILSVSAQDTDIITVDSAIVRLNVGVVDNRGRPITNLNQKNFTIYEDGVKQEIARFEPTVAPFSVVMILDMSGSTIGFRETIRMSALRFIDALAPDDRVAVVEFYDKINLLNNFTTNRKTIANSIRVANGRGRTQLFRALDFAIERLNKEKNRRKAIIVLTDGIDTAVQNSDRDFLQTLKSTEMLNAIKPENERLLVETLSKSDAQGITIYPLALPTGDPARLADPTPIQVAMFTAARQRLEILARRTGGTLNTINRLEEMGRLYAEVAADLRALYTIEYEPKNPDRTGKWREIKLAVDNPQLISRTRTGYFAK